MPEGNPAILFVGNLHGCSPISGFYVANKRHTTDTATFYPYRIYITTMECLKRGSGNILPSFYITLVKVGILSNTFITNSTCRTEPEDCFRMSLYYVMEKSRPFFAFFAYIYSEVYLKDPGEAWGF